MLHFCQCLYTSRVDDSRLTSWYPMNLVPNEKIHERDQSDEEAIIATLSGDWKNVHETLTRHVVIIFLT